MSSIPVSHPIQDLQHYYFGQQQPSTLYELTKGSQHIITGVVMGMIGDMLVYKQQKYNFIQPIKQFLE